MATARRNLRDERAPEPSDYGDRRGGGTSHPTSPGKSNSGYSGRRPGGGRKTSGDPAPPTSYGKRRSGHTPQRRQPGGSDSGYTGKMPGGAREPDEEPEDDEMSLADAVKRHMEAASEKAKEGFHYPEQGARLNPKHPMAPKEEAPGGEDYPDEQDLFEQEDMLDEDMPDEQESYEPEEEAPAPVAASEEDFRVAHGGSFDPNSRMDRAKMEVLSELRAQNPDLSPTKLALLLYRMKK